MITALDTVIQEGRTMRYSFSREKEFSRFQSSVCFCLSNIPVSCDVSVRAVLPREKDRPFYYITFQRFLYLLFSTISSSLPWTLVSLSKLLFCWKKRGKTSSELNSSCKGRNESFSCFFRSKVVVAQRVFSTSWFHPKRRDFTSACGSSLSCCHVLSHI